VLTKLSVLLLFLDILLTAWPRKATCVLLTLTAIFGIWIFLTHILACIPIVAFWKQNIPDRRCIGRPGKWLADAVVNLVLDVAIFCLPLPVVWPMTLPSRQKMWLYFCLALGLM